MKDPTYKFIKGQGWVPSYCKTIIARHDGKEIEIAIRDPLPGECYYRIWNDNSTYYDSYLREPNLNELKDYIESHGPTSAAILKGALPTTTNCAFVTLTFL